MMNFMGQMGGKPPQPSPQQPQSLNMNVSPENRAKFTGFLEGVKSKAVTSQMPPPMPPQMPMQPPMMPPMMPQQPPMMMNMGGMVDVFDPRYMNEGGFVISTDDSGKIRTRPVFDEDKGRMVSQLLSNQMVDEMAQAAMAKANQPEPKVTIIENEQLPSLGDVISQKILSTTVQPKFTGDEANLTGIERIANQPELASVESKNLITDPFSYFDQEGPDKSVTVSPTKTDGPPPDVDQRRVSPLTPEELFGGLGAFGGIESGVDDTSLSEGQGGITGLAKTSTQDQIANLLNDVQSQVSSLISGDVDTIEDMPEIVSSNVEEKIRDAESGVDTSWINDDVLDTIADIETGNSHFETRQAGAGPARPQLTLGAAGELGAYQIMPSTAADPGAGLIQLNPNLKPLDLNNASEAEHREFAKNFLIALQRNNPTASKEEIIRMYNLGQAGAKNNPKNRNYLDKFLASYQSKTGDKRLLNQGGIVQGFSNGGFTSNLRAAEPERARQIEEDEVIRDVLQQYDDMYVDRDSDDLGSATPIFKDRDSDDLGSATNIFTPVGGNFSDFAQSEAPISGIGMEQAVANQAKSIPSQGIIDATEAFGGSGVFSTPYADEGFAKAEANPANKYVSPFVNFMAGLQTNPNTGQKYDMSSTSDRYDFYNLTQRTNEASNRAAEERKRDQDSAQRKLEEEQRIRNMIAGMMPPTAATTPTPPMVGLPDAPVADPVAPDYGSVVVPSDRLPGFDVGKISPYPQFRMPTEYKPIFPPAISANYFKDLFKNMGVKNMNQGGSVNQLDSAIDNFINAYR